MGFFFFKQKTAYEMRISDWSSDVCSSDLHVFYGTGGSMANDAAIRIIHFYFNRLGKRNKKHIISRIDGYHGSTLLTASMTGVMFDRIDFDTQIGRASCRERVCQYV